MTDKPRVVFDCNVLLQAAAREKSVAAKCLNLAESGLIQICVSREVLAEAEDVLNRLELRAYFPDLSDEIVGAFLKRLQNLSELVRLVPKKFSYPATKTTSLTSTLRSRRVPTSSSAATETCWI